MDRRDEDEAAWAALMRAGLAGDAAAYRQLLAAIAPFLRAVVRRRMAERNISGLEAEDCVQEVLLALHLKRGSWDPGRPFRPWLLAILRNKLVDSLRARGHRAALSLEELAEEPSAVPPAAEDGLAARDVARALDRLPPRQQQAVRLIALEGLTAREAGLRMEASEGAMRVLLHRALQALARTVGSETP